MKELETGSLLQGGKYRIEKVLGQGGFGITYEGVQTALDRRVAIKEFFMKDYCDRQTGTSHVSVPSEGLRIMVDALPVVVPLSATVMYLVSQQITMDWLLDGLKLITGSDSIETLWTIENAVLALFLFAGLIMVGILVQVNSWSYWPWSF